MDNSECPPSDYCAKQQGDCTGEGTCAEKPEACPDVWAPVCGCDGQTYGNICEAAAAGVNVDYDGQCEVSTCMDNSVCPPSEYCAKQPGDCTGEGTCAEKPEACLDLWDPVCGCDGQTYGNICYAAAAGVNVDYEGECVVSACTDNSVCSSSAYCVKKPGDCTGEGTCAEKPEACLDLWNPVCGCDGQTYSNICYAAAAGVNVDYEAVCNP
jgi:hypothetical protein